MDIVSRLRQFLEYRNIPVTQFADTCGIPRPTLSQLLNGRNKKVSDELIGKIHAAYPSLSVMWLMFGEGNMGGNGNTETSEPKNTAKTAFGYDQLPLEETFTGGLDVQPVVSPQHPENFRPQKSAMSSPETGLPTEISFFDHEPDVAAASPGQPESPEHQSVPDNRRSKPDDNKRKVSHIIVYYSDNTFETFVPDRN